MMGFWQQYPLFLSFFLALLPFSTIAQNISFGISLTAQEDNSSWASPSGDFAFGFQKIEEDGFLLAIWFNQIPERTIVWSANGDNLAPKGSKVELTTDGFLTLNNPSGKVIWNANSRGSGVAYAAMLDSGNFVLVGQDSRHLWESFSQPTDTILPGQVINQPGKLVSRYLETNYSRGRFQFVLQGDGNLVLYTTNFPLDSPNSAYWNTQIFGNDFSLDFNISGYIFVRASNGSIISMISANAPSTQDFYHRAILEYDGVFRHYVYPKIPVSSIISMISANAPSTQDFYHRAILEYDGVFRHYVHPKSAGSGTISWSLPSSDSFIPPNICSSITEDIGSGACGFNSYCSYDGKKNCRCPHGYSFIDPNDVMKGCKQDFVPQSCDEAHPDTDNFYFDELPRVNWPLSDYGHFDNVNEDWCRRACLGDCFCAVAIYGGGKCWKKKLPLSNGRVEAPSDGLTLIKIRKPNSTNPEHPNKKNDKSILVIVGSVLLSSSVILLGVAFLFAYRFRHSNSKVSQKHGHSQFMAGMNLRNFSYEELSQATDGFKEELGHGAFATVYKGKVLLNDNKKDIAVKRLNSMVKENEKEFKAEVTAIGRTHHRNLVQLLGFCDEGEHKLLVYEYMSKGSLANFIFESERPSWDRRVQIASGIARGLLYLHEECSSLIIHCDIKPQNVLLDDFYIAKIFDFGLTKFLKTNQMLINSAIRETNEYAAPEWFRSMHISFKVDVYSYGVLLLELICCRRSFDMKPENENQMAQVNWAFDCLKYRNLNILLKDDTELLGDMDRVERYLKIAFWCVQEEPAFRPTMRQVLLMLEGVVDVEYPSDPFS